MQILKECIPLHDFPVEQVHSVSPINYGGIFFQKLFMVVGEQLFGASLWEGGSSIWVINDKIMIKVGEFHKCIFR